MFLTTLAWLAVYFGLCGLAFVDPIFGVLAYLFEYYLRPSLHWWGQGLPDLRWNLVVSVVVVVSFLVRRSSLPTLKPVGNPALKWLLAFIALMFVIAPFAVEPLTSLSRTWDFIKYIVIYFALIGIVRTPAAFDAVAALHMGGSAWWGWEAFVHPHRRAGRLDEVGSSDTLNDNLATAHLLTVLPFILVYLFTAKDKRLRALALACAPFVVNLMILCNSRGGMIGLAVGVLAALATVRSSHRVRSIGAVAVLAAMFLGLADPEFINRQQTSANYETESTAVERFASWEGGVQMIKDHPFGAGGLGYYLLSSRYIPEIVQSYKQDGRAPHNTYVLVTAEWGFLGLIFYLAFAASTLLMLSRVRKRSRPDDGFYYRALALQTGLIATMTASTFSDRLYGESFYWMCGLAVALYRMQQQSMAESATAPASEPRVSPVTPRLRVPLAEHA